MRRAGALPAVGRRADLAVRSYGSGIRMGRNVAGLMQRIELGKDLRARALQQGDPPGAQAARADPDAIDAVVGEGATGFKPVGRNPSIEAANLNLGARHRVGSSLTRTISFPVLAPSNSPRK